MPSSNSNEQKLFLEEGLKDIHKIATILHQYGVVVIPNVFSSEECNEWMSQIVGSVQELANVDTNGRKTNNLNLSSQTTIKKTWVNHNLPPQTRYGLFQTMLSHLKPVWQIRKDPRLYEIFRAAYLGLDQYRDSWLRDYTAYKGVLGTDSRMDVFPDFISSCDGINIQPNLASYNVEKNGAGEPCDWAHVDQTIRRDPYRCVQGQVVLTQTDASFRCSPGSHKEFDEIMDLCYIGKDDKSNWCKFTKDQIPKVKVLIPEEDDYQIPIHVNRGSVILWLSTTVHSAMSARYGMSPIRDDRWLGWRGVVYACYRPIEQFSQVELDQLNTCVEQNIGTNHWATKCMHRKDFTRLTISDNMRAICLNPSIAYDILKWRPSRDHFIIRGKEQRRFFEENQAKEVDEVIKQRKKKSAVRNKECGTNL